MPKNFELVQVYEVSERISRPAWKAIKHHRGYAEVVIRDKNGHTVYAGNLRKMDNPDDYYPPGGSPTLGEQVEQHMETLVLHKELTECWDKGYAEGKQKSEEQIERLRAAISDNLPGLSAIDDGTWHEYTGDLVLKEEQWNAIVVATRELRVALAGGEAKSPVDTAGPVPSDSGGKS